MLRSARDLARSDAPNYADGDIPEFPGYVASSMLLKEKADRSHGFLGKYIAGLYYLTIFAFVSVPWFLAAFVLNASEYKPVFTIVVCAGLLLAMLGNGLTVFRFQRKR